jgi:hypothetical protein
VAAVELLLLGRGPAAADRGMGHQLLLL